MRSPYSAEEKQGDRILFGCGGDRLRKRFKNGGALFLLIFEIKLFFLA
jgi:hypothetical protein